MSSRQTRRRFLKTASMAGASALLSPSISIGRSQVRMFSHFGLHPFIEAHPRYDALVREIFQPISNGLLEGLCSVKNVVGADHLAPRFE